jgi:hypothetical protein
MSLLYLSFPPLTALCNVIPLPNLTLRAKLLPYLTSEVVDLLNRISATFGKSVLLDGYSSLKRLAYAVSREKYTQATFEIGKVTFPCNFYYVLQSLFVSMQRGHVTPAFMSTGPNLAAETKGAKPGVADLAMARLTLLKYFAMLVTPLQGALQKEMVEILQIFAVPLDYNDLVPVVDLDNAEGEGEAVDNPLKRLGKGKGRVAQELIKILGAVMDGEHDDALLHFSTQDKPASAFAAPTEVEALKKLGLTKSLTDFGRMLELASDVVVATEEAAGEGGSRGLRALARRASEPEDDSAKSKKKEERARCWKMATAVRKKFVTFSVWKDLPAAQEVVNNMKAKLEAGEGHRLVVLSCDLLQENVVKAWLNLPDKAPTDMTMKADQRLEFMMKQNGPADIILAFDGRSRACRKWLDGKIADAVEVVITYAGKRSCRFRTRQVVFSSKTTEMGLLLFSFARTKLALQEREQFNANQEKLLGWKITVYFIFWGFRFASQVSFKLCYNL